MWHEAGSKGTKSSKGRRGTNTTKSTKGSKGLKGSGMALMDQPIKKSSGLPNTCDFWDRQRRLLRSRPISLNRTCQW